MVAFTSPWWGVPSSGYGAGGVFCVFDAPIVVGESHEEPWRVRTPGRGSGSV